MRVGRIFALLTVLALFGQLVSVRCPLSAQQQPILQVSPPSLEFQGQAGGPDPDPQWLTLINAGTAPMLWHASADVSWITLGATEGKLSGGRVIQLLVLVKIEGLQAGEYRGKITISAEGAQGSPAVVSVRLALQPSAGGSPPPGMVLIPAGSFQMGDSFNEGDSDERPVHTVYVSAFYMDKYEVTKALWDEVASWAQAHGYDIKPEDGSGKGPDHPVSNVTWYEAVKWANARSEREGLTPCYYTDSAQRTVYRTGQVDVPIEGVKWTGCGYRLPTEAEWEKAARGGCEGHRFPWCDTDTTQHARANYYSSSNYSYDKSPTRGHNPKCKTGSEPFTCPVGEFCAQRVWALRHGGEHLGVGVGLV
jgi:formylglycine-generating enzyme required for sulfatase activity